MRRHCNCAETDELIRKGVIQEVQARGVHRHLKENLNIDGAIILNFRYQNQKDFYYIERCPMCGSMMEYGG